MGLLDVIFGSRKLKQPAPDRLFAITTGAITLETEAQLKSTGQGAIVFQPLSTGDFDRTVADMEELVRATGKESDTTLTVTEDKFNYRWMVLSDGDFDDVVVGINAVSTSLQDGGYGDRILCAVFAFKDQRGDEVYWIYNYKRGTFYPFAPAGGGENRDNERELRLKALMARELPIEADLARWFPLWGIPI